MGTDVGGVLLAEIVEVLDEHRVVTIAQLLAHMGEVEEVDVRTAVEQAANVRLLGDLVFTRSALIAGRTYCAEVEASLMIANHDDLSPLMGSQRDLEEPAGVPIASTEWTVVVAGALPVTLEGTAHYVAVSVPDDLRSAEFGVIAPERFEVEHLSSDRLLSGEIEVAALRSALEQWVPAGRGVTSRNLIALAISLNDRCFRSATLPLSDLFAAAGLTSRDGEWGRADQEWSTVSEDVTEQAVDQLGQEHRLSGEEVGDFRALIGQWQEWASGRGTVNATSFAALLTGRVAGAFSDYWQPARIGSPEAWKNQRRLVETLARKHGDHPGVNFLRGMIDLRLGDGSGALGFFEAAHEADEDYLPVREQLSLLLLDGSQIEEALDVMPSDHPSYGAVEYLLERAALDRTLADRGDECRCGSGRKYRTCCARQLRLSVRERLHLIDIRIKVFLSQPPWSMHMDRLADIVSAEWGLMSFPEALADPFVQDVLAVEAGGSASYAAARRGILSDEDAELIAMFTPQSRSAFDVTATDAEFFDLSNPDTGEQVRIGALVQSAGAGDAVLTRTIHCGDDVLGVGPAVLIPASHVSLLRVTLGSRPTAEQLLGWVCRRSEILRPVIDLTSQIDLREQDVVEAGFDLEDLARRALEG